jgi:hypothetical protein
MRFTLQLISFVQPTAAAGRARTDPVQSTDNTQQSQQQQQQ